MKKRRVCIIILVTVCMSLITIGGVVGMCMPAVLSSHQGDTLFTVKRGSSVREIAKDLKASGLIRFEYPVYFYFRVFNKRIKAGTYKLSPTMSVPAICSSLQEGEQELIKVTVPEGLTISKTAALLKEQGIIEVEPFLKAAKNEEILRSFGIQASSAEGFLFPDTYFFSYGESAERIVITMLDNFFSKVKDIPHFPSDSDAYYKAVVLASIIEREYRVPDEAAKIASVFLNRLEIGMPLQSCATVEYILTEVQHKAHPERLFNKDLNIEHPYNTYKWQGLPPGPIANPGMTALYASCNPEKTGYLYFRLKDAEAGTHIFTKTLAEHARAGALIPKRAAGRAN